jgi:large subunit ribosomal protein L21
MYAIVNICGKQYKVRKNDVIEVERLQAKEKAKMKFEEVLLCSNGAEVLIGQPYLSNVEIEAEVLGETKGSKVFAFKFKRRKGYTRKVGHRQRFTLLRIINIESPLKPKEEIKPKAEKIAEKVKEEIKSEKPKAKKPKLDKSVKAKKAKKKITKK